MLDLYPLTCALCIFPLIEKCCTQSNNGSRSECDNNERLKSLYTSVYEKEITLADNSKATALISETDNVRETYANIYKDGILISIRASKEKLTDDFFRSFDIAEMN